MIKSKWELSKSDKQIVKHCEDNNYPIKLKREAIGGNTYLIAVNGKELKFKNDANYIPDGALRVLKMSIKQMVEIQKLEAK